MSKRRQWQGRIYLGRDENGKQSFLWVGRYATRRERDHAVALARTQLDQDRPVLPFCDYGVWFMWTKLGMSPRAIAAQAGWSASTVQDMLKVYGHGDFEALSEVDEAFRGTDRVVKLREVKEAG